MTELIDSSICSKDSENGRAIYNANWDGNLADFSYNPATHKLIKGYMDRLKGHRAGG